MPGRRLALWSDAAAIELSETGSLTIVSGEFRCSIELPAAPATGEESGTGGGADEVSALFEEASSLLASERRESPGEGALITLWSEEGQARRLGTEDRRASILAERIRRLVIETHRVGIEAACGPIPETIERVR